jgi:hypothetical protein
MANASSTADIRSWARSQGIDVPDRGRLNAAVVDAWTAAQSGDAPPAAPAAGAAAPGRVTDTPSRTTKTPSRATKTSARATKRPATKASATKPATVTQPPSTGSAAQPQQLEQLVDSQRQLERQLADVERQCGELRQRLQRLEEARPGRLFRRRQG